MFRLEQSKELLTAYRMEIDDIVSSLISYYDANESYDTLPEGLKNPENAATPLHNSATLIPGTLEEEEAALFCANIPAMMASLNSEFSSPNETRTAAGADTGNTALNGNPNSFVNALVMLATALNGNAAANNQSNDASASKKK